MSDDEREKAREGCREWLGRVAEIDPRAGLYDEANIVEAMEEIIEVELGEPDPALLAEFAAKAKAGLEAQAAIEAKWKKRTPNDAIDDAFEDLNARGIIAEQALGSTSQEGSWKIYNLGLQRGGAFRGQVFYHRQDLESAMAGEGLYLNFDTFHVEDESAAPATAAPAPGASAPNGEVFVGIVPRGLNDVVREKDPDKRTQIAKIGEEILHVLAHHGVGATWSGSPLERIFIKPFPWQKRRTTKRPEGRGPAGPVPPPPAPPPPCEICGGKGWLQASPTDFPEKCVCKGGKPRVPKSAAPPAETRAAEASPVTTPAAVVVAGPAKATSATPPAAALPAGASPSVAPPPAAPEQALAPIPATFPVLTRPRRSFDGGSFARSVAPMLTAVVILHVLKKPPLALTLALAAGAVLIAARGAWGAR